MDNFYLYIIIGIAAAAFVMSSLKDDKKESKKAKEDYYPYKKKFILTPNEYNFFKSLQKIASNNNWMICPKVGLKDMFEVTEKKNSYSYFMKIAQKHVDFLICDQALHPLFAIELDDYSHAEEKTKQSDAFKNKLYQIAELKLIRIQSTKNYSENYIIEALQKNEILKADTPENS